jgi:hypothetical protein
MSNDVYGYAATQQPNEVRSYMETVARHRQIGFKIIESKELFNFPPDLLPKDLHVAFVLGDRPGKVSADYLTDMVDYAPGSLWGLPTLGEERLVILLDWIEGVMLSPLVESLLVAVCECSDVGSWAKVHVHSFRQLMLDDFRREAPPNRLYWIFR